MGDWLRSREIASFFYKHGFALPDQDNSAVLDDALDYQDVKLKIVQQEGYDAHDFNLFEIAPASCGASLTSMVSFVNWTRSLSPAGI